MDLTQLKLNKTEWDSIEIPIPEKEKEILKLILDGYDDTNIKRNHNLSLASFLRMSSTPNLDDYLYKEYFESVIQQIDPALAPVVNTKKMKKSEIMKINLNRPADITMCNVYENKLIALMRTIVSAIGRGEPIHVAYFTLYKLTKNTISRINTHIHNCTSTVLARYADEVQLTELIYDAYNVLETNKTIMENEDMALYTHQKMIFSELRNPAFSDQAATFVAHSSCDCVDDSTSLFAPISKMVLYTAPTGTGKTMTPLALAQNYRVVFVCAARHVGLALAKSAISMGRKVAFAFGCESAADIRLHYSAASVYSTHPKSGKICRVDNSVGDKVEIMICDVKSYLCAMFYMKAFNPLQNLLMYWDEPTISMDYETHPLHEDIHSVWKNNIIPNVVLSSATLPKEQDLADATYDFMTRFPNAAIRTISSHDSKKSIPIITKNGFVAMPHYVGIDNDYAHICSIANHCNDNPTLLRYMDLQECVNFIQIVERNNYVPPQFKIARRFVDIADITVTNIKHHYIHTLMNITAGCWGAVSVNVKLCRKQKLLSNVAVDTAGNRLKRSHSVGPGTSVAPVSSVFGSPGGSELTRQTTICSHPADARAAPSTSDQPGIYVTTKDAYTLTDGPTIFLAEDVEKVAKFYMKQSYIPASVLQLVIQKIDYNNKLNVRIGEIERKLDLILENNANREVNSGGGAGGKSNKSKKKETKTTKDASDLKDHAAVSMNDELSALYKLIRPAELSEVFVPNKAHHLTRWAIDPEAPNSAAFTSSIDDDIVCQIMAIDGVNDTWKILLLMGIGVFTNHTNQSYTEIMKRMATEQRLYLIIASSDYIYGTNYQFCHGYLSKDIVLTQEKMIQALGRIGRNNIQQTYSVRLRDDAHATMLFSPSTNRVEVANMNRMFCST